MAHGRQGPATGADFATPPLTLGTAAEHSSSEGALVLDKLAFPDGGPPMDVTFGCAVKESGEIFRQAADGIMGLGNNANALHSQVGSGGVWGGAAMRGMPDTAGGWGDCTRWR